MPPARKSPARSPARAKSPARAPASSTPSRRSTRSSVTPSRLSPASLGGGEKPSAARAKSPLKKGASASGGSKFWFSKEDVIVVLLAATAWDYTLRKASLMPAALSLDCVNSPVWLGAAAAAAATHAMYAFIWYTPAKFKAVARKLKPLGKNAVEVFHKLVFAGKILQQVALLSWAADAAGTTVQGLLQQASNEQWALFAVLLGAGQYLNAGIYKAIGKDGVYYGFKLGRPVPWATGFPFNLGFRHPQYVGSVLSQLGMVAPLATKATMGAGLLELTLFWVALYVITGIQEATGDNDKKK